MIKDDWHQVAQDQARIDLPLSVPGLEMQDPGPSASVAKTLHLILSLRSPGSTLAQLFINSVQKS